MDNKTIVIITCSILIITCSILASCAARGATAGLRLVEDSTSLYQIVVPDDPIPSERMAATELQDWLEQATGAKLPIVAEAQADPDAPGIWLGQSPTVKRMLRDIDFAALGYDGTVLRTVGRDLVLSGGRPRGVLYAVYTFLEDVVGIRWWTPTENLVPHRPTLDVRELSRSYVPQFICRDTDFVLSKWHPSFAAHLKLNGSLVGTSGNPIPPEYGGHYTILGWSHTFYPLLPPEEYFDEHPEWYSEIGGKRVSQHAQLCLTNEQMRQELVKNALEWIRKDPEAGMISISQNDYHVGCQCAPCRAVDEREGSPSGSLIEFVNKVAEDIEKEYPDFLVETLAYTYTQKPPKTVRPRHNVVIRLALIEADFARPFTDLRNESFLRILQSWRERADRLAMWTYVSNFYGWHQLQPNLYNWAPDLRLFADSHVITMFMEGDPHTATGDFIRLRNWLCGQLLWDPSQDDRALIREFLQGYYQEAAPYLQEWLDIVNEAGRRHPDYIGAAYWYPDFVGLDELTRGEQLFDLAERAVADKPEVLTRVRRERVPLQLAWLLCYDDARYEAEVRGVPFAGPPDKGALYSAFDANLWEFGDGEGMSEIYNTIDVLQDRLARVLIPRRIRSEVPAELAHVPRERLREVQDSGTLDHLGGRVVRAGRMNDPQLVPDELASDGVAAVMPTGVHLSATMVGTWTVYAQVRVATRGDAGPASAAFEWGINDTGSQTAITSGQVTIGETSSDRYRLYDLGTYKLQPSKYIKQMEDIWFRASDNPQVEGIYLDRIVLVRN